MTKQEKRADLEECIKLMRSRALRCALQGDVDGVIRAGDASKGFADQLAEITDTGKEVKAT